MSDQDTLFPSPADIQEQRLQLLAPKVKEIKDFIQNNLLHGCHNPISDRNWDELALKQACSQISQAGWKIAYTRDTGHGATIRFTVKDPDERE